MVEMKITLFEKETHDHRYNFDMDGNSPLDEDLLAPVLYDKDLVLADSKEMNDVVTNTTGNNTEDLPALLSNTSGTSRDLRDDFNDYDYFNIEDRANRILQEADKIVAIILVFVAITANIFSLTVMCKILKNTRGPASHNALIVSLATSDVLFCLTVLLHIVNKILNPLYYPGFGPEDKRIASRCAYTIIKSLNTTALNVNLLNLMGMAIEHYIAILKPLHHSRLLSRKRYTVMILLLWIIAFVFGFSDFIYLFKDWKDWHLYKDKFNLCVFVYISEYHEEYTVLATAFLCLVIMLYVYVRIYREARRHQRREQPADNFRGSQKALVTTLLILGTFMLCWLPMCIFQLVLIIQVHVNPGAVRNLLVILVNADQHLYNLLLLNALLDPIIYAVRIREIRHNYTELLRNMCLCVYVKCKARNSAEDCHYVSVSTDYSGGRRMSRRPSCTPSLTDMDRRMSRVSAGLAPGLPGATTMNPAELTQLQPISNENEPAESTV